MKQAWRDYKIKKAHVGFENWKFSDSLYWSHRHTKQLISQSSCLWNEPDV